MVKYALLQFAALLSKDDVDIPDGELNAARVAQIMTVIFSIIGGVALIVIIISGFKFILSEGNPDKVAKARNTIVYAAIGLAVCVSASAIVNLIAGRL